MNGMMMLGGDRRKESPPRGKLSRLRKMNLGPIRMEPEMLERPCLWVTPRPDSTWGGCLCKAVSGPCPLR